MYNSANVAIRIKEEAKRKGLAVGKVLEDCGLSKNTLSSMTSRGSWLQANSLALIADRLGCSVDYLLDRHEAVPASTGNTGRMVMLFRELTSEQQELMIANAEMLLRSNPQPKAAGAELV